MGRQALVTLDHVKAAVAALRSEEKVVSSRSVRDKLGNVGSMGTINKLLQQALSETSPAPDSLRQLPPELQRSILGFADQQAEGARAQIAEDLVQCRLEMAELAVENERLTTMIDELRNELASTAAEKARLEGKVSQLGTELAAAREETAAERLASQATRVELIKLQLRVDALSPLERELSDTRALCEEQRHACNRAEQANAVLETRLGALDSQAQDLKRELDEARANSVRLSKKAEKIQEMLGQEREARVLAERELAIGRAMEAKRNPRSRSRKTKGQLDTLANR